MNKSKFYLLIISLLVISNGMLLTILLKSSHRNEGPKSIIIEKLHFDKEQIEKYETCIEQHRASIRKNEALINHLRGELFKQLNNEQHSSKVDSLIGTIAKQQIAAENINYKHFLEIKKICKPSQKKDFINLTTEIVHLFSLKERK